MSPLNELDPVENGRRLGHDFHRMSRLPMQACWPASVREGFQASACRGQARNAGDRFERKWLQLRLSACQRGRVVASDVTPALLRLLDVTHCPITRELLSHSAQADSDWSIDRLNNDGAYAASNLAVMSVRANQAKGARCFDEVLAASRLPQATGGLTPIQWLRLAVLMEGPSFTTQALHLAPTLPLCAPLPCRSVRLALQQVQRLFTLQCAQQAGKNRLLRELRRACADERSRLRLRALGDAVHEGLKRLTAHEQVWDVWLQTAPMDALRRWRESLDDPSWALAAAVSGQLAGGRSVTAASLERWHLGTRGYQFPPASQRRFSISQLSQNSQKEIQ